MTRFPVLGVGFLIRSVSLVVAAIALLGLPAPADAAFPGANGKIAFTRIGTTVDIYAMNPDGSGQTNLTNTNFSMGDPAWSPDGSKIAFYRNPGSYAFEIYVMNADGSNQTRVTFSCNQPEFPLCVLANTQPAWSPDSSKIAFAADVGSTATDQHDQEIAVIDADGSNLRRLTSDPANDDSAPAWSPDGSKIAFQKTPFFDDEGQHFQSPSEIYVMNADGSAPANVTNNPDWDKMPDWSPDGQRIVFTRRPASACCNTDVYSMNANGTGVVPLTTTGKVTGGAVFSPDGRKIAFPSNASANDDIFSMNADGTAQVQLTSGAGWDDEPDWQPLQRPHTAPVGASPIRVSLVPAFMPCETGNSDATHGVPLNFPSCASPQPTSSTVTTGSNALGFARLVACWVGGPTPICNPQGGGFSKPDVRILGSIRDVRCAANVPAGCSPGADYNPNTAPGPYTTPGNGADTGGSPPCFPSATSQSDCLAGADMTWVAELPGAATGASGSQFEGRGVRITDADNDPAKSASGTVIDLGFPIPLDCLPNPSATQGSTCGVSTTANALVPGVVKQGEAAVWQVGQVELKDSGPDGTRGNSDDELFAVQGVFLP